MGFFMCSVPAIPGNRTILEALDVQGRIAFDHFHEVDGQLNFTLTSDELDVVRAHGVAPIIIEDIEKAAETRRQERTTLGDDDTDDALATGFVDQYLDAEEVAARITALVAEFPALCHLSILPEPTEGYDGSNGTLLGPSTVQLLRLTTNAADRSRPALLLVCGTHAREWVNPLIAIEFAEQLVRNHDPTSTDPEVLAITRILQEGEVFIVPVMNPDGLNFSIHDSVGWRKNRRPNPGLPACPGVDLNRNYEIFFGGAGASASECSSTYRGPSAFSEPENRNMRFVAENFPNILIAVDSHSQGEKIFRPVATGGTFISALPVSPEDELIYQQLEAAANAAIHTVSGKTYLTGTTSNHAGTSDEYLFFAHRVFAFDFESALAHQPPISSALVSVQEVTAALRALATKAIDLDVSATVPARIVQAIDRTGSMAAFGYDDDAQANAKRFLDLMSMGDSVGIVSFADPSPDPDATAFSDRARVDLPLSPLTPASLIQGRDTIDALDFGGWTSLGAGLQAAAEQLAVGTTERDAVVLLSDGFENREPWTLAVMAGFPAGLRVFTVALGDQSDIPLLQQIATDTGGTFHLSPTSFELYEIYNQIRADSSDDDLVLNDIVHSQGDDDEQASDFWVEDGVSRLLVSISWPEGSLPPDCVLIDPYGRRPRRKDWGYERRERSGHVTLRVLRPVPGRWTLCVKRRSGPVGVAAFVRSPLQVCVTPEVVWDRKRRLAAMRVCARSRFAGGIELDGSGALTKTAAWTDKVPGRSLEWLDAGGRDVRTRAGTPRARAIDDSLRVCGVLNSTPVCVAQGGFLTAQASSAEYDLCFDHALMPGVYSTRVRIRGSFAMHGRFERVMQASVVVAP